MLLEIIVITGINEVLVTITTMEEDQVDTEAKIEEEVEDGTITTGQSVKCVAKQAMLP